MEARARESKKTENQNELRKPRSRLLTHRWQLGYWKAYTLHEPLSALGWMLSAWLQTASACLCRPSADSTYSIQVLPEILDLWIRYFNPLNRSEDGCVSPSAICSDKYITLTLTRPGIISTGRVCVVKFPDERKLKRTVGFTLIHLLLLRTFVHEQLRIKTEGVGATRFSSFRACTTSAIERVRRWSSAHGNIK